MPSISPIILSEPKMTQDGGFAVAQPLTMVHIKDICDFMKASLRFNMMTREPEFLLPGRTLSEYHQQLFIEEVLDNMVRCGIPRRRDEALTALATLALSAPYHPVEELVRSVTWDGVDHIKALTRSVPTDSPAWPVYLRKWLVQMVEGVCGWHDSATRQLPHVIVFSGDQGIGKGRWIASLLPASMVLTDAHLDVANKDDVLVALKRAVVELGEIDATFRKADISRLKSFLSRSEDVIREPYARRPNSRPRMTSFIGSVNHEEFLSDVTGSRRFWPVVVREGCKLDWGHGVEMAQVFAQALELWIAGDDYNLSESEEVLRREESAVHQTVSVTVDLLEAHMSDLASAFPKYAIMNAGELLQSIGVRHASQPQRVEVSAWLKNNVGAARKLRGKQKSWCLPIGMTGLNAKQIMSFQTVTPEYAKKVFGQYTHADRWVTEGDLAAAEASEQGYH